MSVATTGIRDAGSRWIVEQIVELGKALRKREDGTQRKTEEEIQLLLRNQFDKLLNGTDINEHINCLLNMQGIHYLFFSFGSSDLFFKVLIFIKTHPPKFSTPFSLVWSNIFGVKLFTSSKSQTI